MKKQKNMKNRDLYETLRIHAKMEAFTNHAQNKLKKNKKKQGCEKHVFRRSWTDFGLPKSIEKVRFF